MTSQTCAYTFLVIGTAFAQSSNWQDRFNSGSALERAGKYAEALECYRDAARIAEQFEPRDARRVVASNRLATAYDQVGQFSDAEREYRRALLVAERIEGKASSDYAVVLGNLGSLYFELGQSVRGEALMRQAVAIHMAAGMPGDVRLAVARRQLAEILLQVRKLSEAERLLDESRMILQNQQGAIKETSAVLNDLGLVARLRGRFAQAEDLFNQSIAVVEREMGPDHPLLLQPLINIAKVHDRTGGRDEAGRTFRRALAIAETHLGDDHPAYAVLLYNYSAFLRHIGDKTEARATEIQAQRLLRETAHDNVIGRTIDASELGRK